MNQNSRGSKSGNLCKRIYKGCDYMAEIKDIWEKNLPNFGYVIEMDHGLFRLVVLGGQSCLPADRCHSSREIEKINYQMQDIYHGESLSDEDKEKLAKLMKKMHNLCECREGGLFTVKEQMKFVESLSDGEQEQIKEQVQIHLDCRDFYREYIHNRR